MSKPKRSTGKKKHILASGTVPWTRNADGSVDVLLINRWRQDDMTFPKGKVDSGESMPVAAVRETLEEVGIEVSLGSNLGTINYLLKNEQRKTVQYWAAKVSNRQARLHEFTPNDEVRSAAWVPLGEVRETLSYEADREIFDVFNNLVSSGAVDTFSVILLRHAKALPRGPENPIDRYRPLSDEGEDRAEMLVPMLAAFGPKRIESSSAVRCLATVAPLAAALGKDVRCVEGLSQEAWDSGEVSKLRESVQRAVERSKNSILCSHRPVLPDLARELIEETESRAGNYLQDATNLPPGAFSVFHIARGGSSRRVVSVEVYPVKQQ